MTEIIVSGFRFQDASTGHVVRYDAIDGRAQLMDQTTSKVYPVPVDRATAAKVADYAKVQYELRLVSLSGHGW